MALPKQNRIRRTKDFETIFKKGRSTSGTFLFIKSLPAQSGESRFAFVVSSRVAKTAVYRNQVRRTLSAASQGLLKQISPARDTVVVVNKKAETEELKKDFLDTLKKAAII